MANIISARFTTQAEVDRIVNALSAEGFRRDEYFSFFLNPPGQHALHPLGGDSHHSEGTRDAGATGERYRRLHE